MAQGCHLVENAAKGPDITFVVIWLVFANLWRKIVWRSNGCFRELIRIVKNTSNAKVAQFDKIFLGEKNVLSFEISVENFSIVDMLESKTDLNEEVQDFFFAEMDSFPRRDFSKEIP